MDKKQLPESRQIPSLWTNILPSSWPNFVEDFLPFNPDFSARGARVYEEGNQLHVEVPLPGLKLDEIEVNLNKGILQVKGESKEEESDKKRKFYRSSKRSYSYSLILPTQTDEKQEPQAVYTDGVLNITLQLAKQTEGKKIAITSGNGKK